MVVTDHQSCQCICGFTGPTGLDGDFYAGQNTDSKNFPHSNLSGSFMAENSGFACHEFVSAVRLGTEYAVN